MIGTTQIGLLLHSSCDYVACKLEYMYIHIIFEVRRRFIQAKHHTYFIPFQFRQLFGVYLPPPAPHTQWSQQNHCSAVCRATTQRLTHSKIPKLYECMRYIDTEHHISWPPRHTRYSNTLIRICNKTSSRTASYIYTSIYSNIHIICVRRSCTQRRHIRPSIASRG